MSKELRETKRDKFVSIAESRTNKSIDMLRLLGNCSNTNTYEYTEKDVNKIFNILERELKSVKNKFVEEKKLTRIKDRYLMRNSGDKSLLRNQILRLWWMVHSTYDNTIDDPYEYTEFLLSNSDFQVGIMERTFSGNSSFIKNFIKSIKSYSEEYEYPNKEMLRIFLNNDIYIIL